MILMLFDVVYGFENMYNTYNTDIRISVEWKMLYTGQKVSGVKKSFL